MWDYIHSIGGIEKGGRERGKGGGERWGGGRGGEEGGSRIMYSFQKAFIERTGSFSLQEILATWTHSLR
jgi:hypothetical protein